MCRAALMLLTLFPLAVLAAPPPVPSPARIDAEAQRLMQAAQARGMALAVIDGGKVVHVAAYGERNTAGEPLRTDTVMYAASLTKMAFGHLVAQLAQDRRIDLDASIATALDKPLPDYPPETKKYADYRVLADDARVEEVLELVDHDQEDERRDRHRHALAQAHHHDCSV